MQKTLFESFSSPVVEKCDVLICGGGPAGVASALAAARSGAKTTLIEVHGCLGGVWTAGCLSWLIDYKNKSGIMAEILQRLEQAGGRAITRAGERSSAYDPEIMKCLLEEMVVEAGIHVRLHSRIVAAHVDDEGRLSHVISESKSGREAWSANVFIDATGDGDLAAQAGCGFDMGHPESKETQPMSLMALLTGLDPEKIKEFFEETSGDEKEHAKSRLFNHLKAHGHSPSYASPTLFRIRDGLFALMANHEYGVLGINAEDVTKATLNARRELNSIIRTLKESGPPWDNISLVATAGQIGIREGRRIHGRYRVTIEDLLEGRKHEDCICEATFCVDVHSTNPRQGKGYSDMDLEIVPYQIPLRAAIAADVNGLMMAGRCISGDFFAHASYRVTGNAVLMGENVGKAAAYASENSIMPHEIISHKLATV
ncbi:FAD-dependent oxidoreductase [Cerasicoccus arenae]|uniref:FAD-dependent oxidoreductase n=1 Tax=Cerasicoccus arenae TaxID=424488 RepID=A0A8J3DL70_9BACT|nr:FAD-dependent oxidoreductase [Cerasicoccus arenae]MBK1858573.1 FAD-dependent oxidoreductase [Cerasicoccus arenae]GHC06378.1 hypothetical protein GCM10007047_24390 [Cerasicoccus arenae]